MAGVRSHRIVRAKAGVDKVRSLPASADGKATPAAAAGAQS
jgi:hypothetical protein